MSWTFEQLQQASQSGITALVHDGRNVWASSGATIKVYSYIDNEHLDETAEFERIVFDLTLVTTITHSATVDAMAVWNGKVYVKNGLEVHAYSPTTFAQVGLTIILPDVMQSVIGVANNRLWFVTYDADATTDRQSLYYYNLLTSTWSTAILIPGKKQYITRSIVDGLDGYLYLTNMNEHAILKFATDGTYIAQYRINRHPYALYANQLKGVYIASDPQTDPLLGMVSVFDQSSNTSTNVAAAGGNVVYLCHEEYTNKIWYVGGSPKIAQLNRASGDFRYVQDPLADDYVPGAAISFDDFPTAINTTFIRGLLTPQLTFDVWSGSAFVSKTVKPYLFFSNSTTLYAARLSSMVRVNSMDVLGTAMVTTGAQNYYGDLV